MPVLTMDPERTLRGRHHEYRKYDVDDLFEAVPE